MATKNKTGPGRPKNSEVDLPARRANILEALEDQTNRTCGLIHDHSSRSVAAFIARAAKNGVPQESLAPVIAGLEAAMTDLRAAYARAYSPDAPKAHRTSRVTLG